MAGELSLRPRNCADPACAAHEFALLQARGLPVVGKQMKDALQIFRLEE
jgi:hypothetical protein